MLLDDDSLTLATRRKASIDPWFPTTLCSRPSSSNPCASSWAEPKLSEEPAPDSVSTRPDREQPLFKEVRRQSKQGMRWFRKD